MGNAIFLESFAPDVNINFFLIIFKEAVVSKNQKFFVLKSPHEISHICRVTILKYNSFIQ